MGANQLDQMDKSFSFLVLPPFRQDFAAERTKRSKEERERFRAYSFPDLRQAVLGEAFYRRAQRAGSTNALPKNRRRLADNCSAVYRYFSPT